MDFVASLTTFEMDSEKVILRFCEDRDFDYSCITPPERMDEVVKRFSNDVMGIELISYAAREIVAARLNVMCNSHSLLKCGGRLVAAEKRSPAKLRFLCKPAKELN
jgi:hypothetical protein